VLQKRSNHERKWPPSDSPAYARLDPKSRLNIWGSILGVHDIILGECRRNTAKTN